MSIHSSFSMILMLLIINHNGLVLAASNAFQAESFINDYPFHNTLMEDDDTFGFESFASQTSINDTPCQEIWCEKAPNIFNNYYEDIDNTLNGFWLESPPDDILYIPPPPIPPALSSWVSSLANESIRDFIIGEDPIEGVRCNFCKLFADSKLYQHDSELSYPSSTSSSKDNKNPTSLIYVAIFSLVFIMFCAVCLLIKHKKWCMLIRYSCPIWSSPNGIAHHHKSASSSSSTSPSDACLSPVVNEKSSQSIIMDAPLASFGKKSTISTTGKYWKRVPNNVPGNILFMEDRKGLRSIGGSSTGNSDHPYSDGASCTSSPVYAELDPTGACHSPPIIPPPIGTPFVPYAYSNTYTEVPERMRIAKPMSSTILLSDSSTYDNAAYLPASSQQPFFSGTFGGVNNYNTRSLRRLAAQRSAAINAALTNNQISTPLLSNQQYPNQSLFTAGRNLRKANRTVASTPLSVNYFKNRNDISTRSMNFYVTNDQSIIEQNDFNATNPLENGAEFDSPMFGSFIDQSLINSSSNGSGSGQRKSSASSTQYTEMPLIPVSSPYGSVVNAYRMSETLSNTDLNSAASSVSGNGGSGGTGVVSSSSSTSLKRPLPPVPNSVRL
ncbi:Laminin subunit alpha-1 [Sarcoptes scabiei]|nr:Laminin subunit alpha-1 [Sarcoptes scabiei]